MEEERVAFLSCLFVFYLFVLLALREKKLKTIFLLACEQAAKWSGAKKSVAWRTKKAPSPPPPPPPATLFFAPLD